MSRTASSLTSSFWSPRLGGPKAENAAIAPLGAPAAATAGLPGTPAPPEATAAACFFDCFPVLRLNPQDGQTVVPTSSSAVQEGQRIIGGAAAAASLPASARS